MNSVNIILERHFKENRKRAQGGKKQGLATVLA